MAITRTRLGTVVPGTTATRRMPANNPFDPVGGTSATDTGDSFVDEDTGGSSSGAASMLRAQTAYQKFLTDLAASQAKQAREQQGAALQAQFLQRQLGAGVPSTITGEIGEQERIGREFIENQATALLNLLGGRRTQAQERVGTGYNALATYLQQNVPQAFAQAQRSQPQTVESALGQYMAGQGVSPAVAQEAARVANVQAAGGAANFNQLLDVLAAREAAAQQSRLTEAEQARTAALTGIESIYGAGTAQLEQQRLQALADLANRISTARLAAQQTATSREQDVQDALTKLLGTGNLPPDVVETITGIKQPVPPTPVEQLAAKTANIKNQALVKKIDNFVASNPDATPAQIRKQFPSLGKNIK